MKTARIPVPSLVFGSYPQRDARAIRQARRASAWTRVLSPLLLWGAAARLSNVKHFVEHVRRLQQEVAGDAQPVLQARVARLRAALARDGLADDAVAEAFAVVAVTCQRELGLLLYDTQLMAARIMLDGHLAEMATGEGKTLAAAVTASTAALAGIPVHVITANDYLVERDSGALRPLYEALSLSVGLVTQPLSAAQRAAAYACDITYCTAKELVFDYLRDGVAAPRRSELEQRAAALNGAPARPRLLRGLCMAIIDEADSILIDEARVPLVLSQAVAERAQAHLRHAWRLAARCEPKVHFGVDPAARSAQLTAQGRGHLRELAQVGGYAWLNQRHCEEAVVMALTARHVLTRGRDYVVEDGRVHLIDEATGRKAQGRAWSQGLHQLVETKEGCVPSAPLATVAQVTYQRFFPRYFRLCGMSGTLKEVRGELRRIYGVQVVSVPLRKPSRRVLLPARGFADDGAQVAAVAARVREVHLAGRPVLIGSDSVLASEALSRALAAQGLQHTLLNASQDRHEAAVIAAAGAPGAITVATNMAGRGTDIVLAAASREAGGLHVICCQQNAARRIDRQLLGRCARQGDPGSAEFFVSLAGPLLASATLLSSLKNNFIIKYLHKHDRAGALLQLAQRAAARRHARELAALMRADQQRGDWLAFSGAEQ